MRSRTGTRAKNGSSIAWSRVPPAWPWCRRASPQRITASPITRMNHTCRTCESPLTPPHQPPPSRWSADDETSPPRHGRRPSARPSRPVGPARPSRRSQGCQGGSAGSTWYRSCSRRADDRHLGPPDTSMASRSPSPRRLNERTAKVMASPGNIESHGAWSR